MSPVGATRSGKNVARSVTASAPSSPPMATSAAEADDALRQLAIAREPSAGCGAKVWPSMLVNTAPAGPTATVDGGDPAAVTASSSPVEVATTTVGPRLVASSDVIFRQSLVPAVTPQARAGVDGS